MARPQLRRIHVADLETTTNHKVIEVVVRFNAGGMNYSTYKQEKKGYYVHVQPVEVVGNMRTFVAFTGFKSLLEETARFSMKRLKELADGVLKNSATQELIGKVCEQSNLTLEPPAGFKDSMGNEY